MDGAAKQNPRNDRKKQRDTGLIIHAPHHLIGEP